VESVKSGTNHFHGDLFEFIRNADLNANTWQNKANVFVTGPTGSIIATVELSLKLNF
jgi:hypothetical protein